MRMCATESTYMSRSPWQLVEAHAVALDNCSLQRDPWAVAPVNGTGHYSESITQSTELNHKLT